MKNFDLVVNETNSSVPLRRLETRLLVRDINGAVYGCPEKIKDGRTHLGNLFLCGTDQGFLGITGSMLSGISIANLHLLK